MKYGLRASGLLALLFPILCSSSYRPLYRIPGHLKFSKELEFSLKGNYWQSSSRWDVDGNEVPFTEGQGYSRIDIDALALYAPSRPLALFGGLKGRVHSFTTSSDEVRVSGVESAIVGVRYALGMGPSWSLAGRASVRQSFYTNDEYTDVVAPIDDFVLGDSGTTVNLLAEIGVSLDHGFGLGAQSGLRFASNSRSSEIPYSLELAFATKVFALRTGIEGVHSVKTDDFNDQRPSQATGVTAEFNSLNREELSPYLAGRIGGKHFHIEGKISHRVYGVSQDQGTSFELGLTWNSVGRDPDKKVHEEFLDYSLEAVVIKVSRKRNFVKVDKGIAQGLNKGLTVDFYESDVYGKNILLARGKVVQSKSDEAIVKIHKFYSKRGVLKDDLMKANE